MQQDILFCLAKLAGGKQAQAQAVVVSGAIPCAVKLLGEIDTRIDVREKVRLVYAHARSPSSLCPGSLGCILSQPTATGFS